MGRPSLSMDDDVASANLCGKREHERRREHEEQQAHGPMVGGVPLGKANAALRFVGEKLELLPHGPPHRSRVGACLAYRGLWLVAAASRVRCGRRGPSPHRRRNDRATERNRSNRGRRGRACSALGHHTRRGQARLLNHQDAVPGFILAPWPPPRQSHPAPPVVSLTRPPGAAREPGFD